MKFEVESEIVEPIIRDKIAAAVVSQLGDTRELLERMVALALSVKVNKDGEVSKYNSDNKFDFVEAVAGRAIREAATLAIQRLVEEQKPAIQAALVAELKRAPAKTARSILSAFLEGVSKDYMIRADFTIEVPKRY